MMTTIQRNLFRLLPLLTALSACTADVASPTDGELPSGDPIPVRISTAVYSDYGADAGSTRSGSKMLLNEQVMIEDTWADPAQTRSPGYLPTPAATLTLTEEAPSATRATQPGEMEVGKEYLLLCYRRDEDGNYGECIAMRGCKTNLNMSTTFIFGSGCTADGDYTGLFLAPGTYRFIGFYSRQQPADNIFSYTSLADFHWGETTTWEFRHIIDDNEVSHPPHDLYLYDSGDLTVTREPVSLNVNFRPTFYRMKVTVDFQELYQHAKTPGTDVYDEKIRLLIAPDVLNGQDVSWTIGNNTVTYPALEYTIRMDIDPLYYTEQRDGLCEFEFVGKPLDDAPLYIPYLYEGGGLLDLITIPELRTRGNVTLEPGKSYHLKLEVSPHYVQILYTGYKEINELWWMTEYVNGGGWVSTDQANAICSTLNPILYGNGWRLPTPEEIKKLSNLLTTNSTMGYIKSDFPVLWFATSGYKSGIYTTVEIMPNGGGPSFPSSEIASGSVFAIHGKEAKSFNTNNDFGASPVQCVKGPKH